MTKDMSHDAPVKRASSTEWNRSRQPSTHLPQHRNDGLGPSPNASGTVTPLQPTSQTASGTTTPLYPPSSSQSSLPLFSSLPMMEKDSMRIDTKQSPLYHPDPHEDPNDRDDSASFSWEKDEDLPQGNLKKRNTTLKRTTRCGACIYWYRKWPLSIRTLLYIGTGWIILLIPALISLLIFVENKTETDIGRMRSTYFTIGGFPFFTWAMYLGISWTSFFGFRYGFHVLPDMLVRLADMFIEYTVENSIYTDKVSHYVDYVRYLKPYLAFLMWCVTNLITWTAIFSPNTREEWQAIIGSLLLGLTLSCAVFCGQKFLLQVFAVFFHKRVYADRIKHDKNNLKILERLNVARKKATPTSSPNDTQSPDDISFSTHSKINPLRQFKNKALTEATNVSKGVINVLGAAVGVRMGDTAGVVLRNSDDAKKFAKTLFQGLTRGIASHVYLEDFLPYFSKREDATKAFAVFDKDGNGDISKREMKLCILGIYGEHAHLENSMRQSSQAIAKLDNLMKVFVCIIVMFIFLSVFQIDTTKQMAAFISIWAGTVFAIGGTIKDLVESMIFLFITHPYDVGDRVDIENESFIVKEFHLSTTILTRLDGKEIYAPNSVLSKKLIHNVRRSGPQSEDVQLRVALDTSPKKIQQLKEVLVEYLEKEEARDFVPKIGVNIKEILDKKTMIVSLRLEHKNNWQDGVLKVSRHNRFMWKLIDTIKKLDIELIEDSA